MFGLSAVQDIAVGQIKGYIQPTAVERAAAFELFVELSSRTATVTLADEHRLIRDVLDNLVLMPDITRSVLRQHGTESTKQRKDGNLALAAVALRVVNEIILPRVNRWNPLLRHWEEQRPPDCLSPEWEWRWSEFENCQADLESMRMEIRAYLDTLAKIAGAPALGDLVVPNPPGLPIPPITLPEPVPVADGTRPRERMVGWVNPFEHFATWKAHRHHNPKKAEGRRPASDAPPEHIDLSESDLDADGRYWFDYVADMGDGFDPTAAVAWQLTRPSITLPIDRTGELPKPPSKLSRGRLLVMGGDQIYPHASARGYEKQLILPYQLTASAQVNDGPPSTDENTLIAIPGNHDWIGGPEFFEDVFVHAEQFAEHWRTPQAQRWWAVQLPGRWWLWGIDTALDNRIPEETDAAQLRYFDEMSQLLAEGDQVIVCTPVPLWQLRQKREEEYFELRKQLSTWINTRGARSPLFISGDTHMFAYYRRVDGAADEHHICAGGGGAFLQPTHNLPEQVPYERGATDFKLGQRWPRPVDSRSLGASLGALSQNQFRILFVIVGAIHAGFAALVRARFFQSPTDEVTGVVASVLPGAEPAGDAATVPKATGLETAFWYVVNSWVAWPVLLLLLAAMVAATVPNSRESSLTTGAKRYGAMHGFAQIGLFIGIATAGVYLWPETWWWRYLIAPGIGGVLSVAMFVWFLRWINRSIRASDTLAFSPAHLTRYKNFVRMFIDAQGDLTVYVVGLDPVGRKWFHALTKPDGIIPPYDRDGVPRLHYVWGRTFTKGGRHQIMELERLLGADHPDTIFHRGACARHLLDIGDAPAATEVLNANLASCLNTHGREHAVTAANLVLMAEARIDVGDLDDAINLLHIVLGDDPDAIAGLTGQPAPHASYLLAVAYDRKHEPEAGVRWLDRALAPAEVAGDWTLELTYWRIMFAEMLHRIGETDRSLELWSTLAQRTLEHGWQHEHLLARIEYLRILVTGEFEGHVEGVVELEALVQICESEESELAAEARSLLADAYELIGRPDQARDLRREVVHRAESNAPSRPQLSERVEALVALARDSEHYPNKVAYLESALAEARSIDGSTEGGNSWQQSYVRYQLAEAVLESGDAYRAIGLITAHQADDPEWFDEFWGAHSNFDLARAHVALGHANEALALLEELDQQLAGGDPRTGFAYLVWHELTALLIETDLDRATARARVWYAQFQELPDDDRTDEVSACLFLADLYAKNSGQYIAIELVNENLELIEGLPDWGFLERALTFLIRTHVEVGQLDEAVAVLMNWRERHVGAMGTPFDPNVHLALMVALFDSAGEDLDPDTARALVDEMLVITSEVHGAGSDEAREVRRHHARLELQHGSATQAAHLWDALLNESWREPGDSKEAADRFELASALWECDDADRALEQAELALFGEQQWVDQDAALLVEMRFRIGQASIKVGDFDRAHALLRASVDTLLAASATGEAADVDPADLAASQSMLAVALDGLGRRAEAVDMAFAARATAAAAFPRSHPDRLEVEEIIAPVLAARESTDENLGERD